MNPDAAPAYLQLISSAVTPVVMISACSGLLITINNKHSDLSTRLRNAALEIRHTDASEMRRRQLLRQVEVFQRRFFLVQYALISLYGAIAVFMATTLFILFSRVRRMESDNLTVGLFSIGAVLIVIAVACEVIELLHATTTLRLETQDLHEIVDPKTGETLPPPTPR